MKTSQKKSINFENIFSFKISSLRLRGTVAPPCTGAMSLPIVCIMWLPRQCNLPIVTSQWVFNGLLCTTFHERDSHI